MNPSRVENARPLKAVLFDFGGTLDADGVAWKDHFYPFYVEAGLAWAPGEFDKLFYASDDFLTEKKLHDESYLEMLDLQVSGVLKRGQAYDKALARRIAHGFYEDCLNSIRRNRPVLEKLSRRFSLGIVSNFYGNLPVLIEETGLDPLFDAVIDSGRAGFLKPDPRIFLAALERVGAGPGEALFVGDSPRRDMAGAKGLGMRHVLLRSPAAEKDAERMKRLQTCCPNDPVIHSLLELEAILP